MRKVSCFLLLLVLTGCQSSHVQHWSSFFKGEPDAQGVHSGYDVSANDPSDLIEECRPSSAVPVEVNAGVLEDDELIFFDENLFEEGDEELSEVAVEIPGYQVKFELPVSDHPKVKYFVKNFSGPGARGFKRRLERSGRYIPLMKEIFSEEGLPEDLVYVAMVESGFVEHAYSWAKAAGPWQFIEGTGKIYGLQNDWWRDERRDPVKSTRAAAQHLKKLYRQFDDWQLAVAAYNAGAGTIFRGIRKTGSRDFFELSRRNYLRAETKNYVPKFLATLIIARDPEQYGFKDLDYHSPLAFDRVTVATSTDLEVIARLSNSTYKKIKYLNPELKRWCTPPGKKNYKVKIPAGLQDEFHKNFVELPASERAKFKRHKIKSGDTLGALARRYHIQVRDIIALNSIKNTRGLQIGDNLILPLKDGYTRLPMDELKDDYKRSRRKTYRVRKGDSLWKIARKFDVPEKNLRVWNTLGWSNTLRPGQVLVVSKKGAVRKGKTSKGRYKVEYTIVAGDNLWDIGREFRVGTRDIQRWNNLSARHILRPGKKLTLYVDKVSGSKNLSVVSDSKAPGKAKYTGPRKKVAYTVRPGDNLWDIGLKFRVGTRDIQRWNNLSPKHILRPGDRLTLHVPENLESPLLSTISAVPVGQKLESAKSREKLVYQVRTGDTLWGISRQFNVATREILHWNNLNDRHVLQPGDKLTLHVETNEKS